MMFSHLPVLPPEHHGKAGCWVSKTPQKAAGCDIQTHAAPWPAQIIGPLISGQIKGAGSKSVCRGRAWRGAPLTTARAWAIVASPLPGTPFGCGGSRCELLQAQDCNYCRFCCGPGADVGFAHFCRAHCPALRCVLLLREDLRTGLPFLPLRAEPRLPPHHKARVHDTRCEEVPQGALQRVQHQRHERVSSAPQARLRVRLAISHLCRRGAQLLPEDPALATKAPPRCLAGLPFAGCKGVRQGAEAGVPTDIQRGVQQRAREVLPQSRDARLPRGAQVRLR